MSPRLAPAHRSTVAAMASLPFVVAMISKMLGDDGSYRAARGCSSALREGPARSMTANTFLS